MDISSIYKIIKESKVNRFDGAGIVFYDGERVLLLKKPNGKWGFCGGKSIENEKPLDTAIRETKEEIGTIRGERKKEIEIKIRKNTYYTYVYKVKEAFYDIKLSEEHIDFSWVKIKNLEKIKLSKVFKIALNQISKTLKTLR